MSLDMLKSGVSALVVIALIAAALALAMDAYQDDIGEDACADKTTTTTYNATAKNCYEAANASNTASITEKVQWNATEEGLEGIGNASSYLSTIGTLIGVAALIAIVMGAFYFVGRKR